MTFLRLHSMTVLAVTLLLLSFSQASHAGWRAGIAKADITPAEPLWMSGYASRNQPAQGTLHPLWAKSLVLRNEDGKQLLIVSLDLVGIDHQLSKNIKQRLEKKTGLSPDEIALFTSHTHTGPVAGKTLLTMYSLTQMQLRQIREYTDWLEDKIVHVALEAVENIKPMNVSFGQGIATFAVNRRNNREPDVPQLRAEGKLEGPVDHSVPVMKVTDKDGTVKAILFGYACHATTLSFYQWSGDWPGFAQIEIEKKYPEATALFFAGCGGDQNPLPRRTIELAEKYGEMMAEAVAKVVDGDMKSLPEEVESWKTTVDLAFDHIPTAAELAEQRKSDNRYIASRAKELADKLEKEGEIPATYPYPLQFWSFADQLDFVIMGGEVTVDYALRFKQELQTPHVWVAGYANDVMAYIPSERVLREGGYEGERSMIYYGQPSKWETGLEDKIIETVLSFDD